MLDRDLLLPASPVSLEGLHLSRECPGELVEGALRTVLLRDVLNVIQATREGHGCVVDGGHLSREHGFNLVPWLDAFDHCQHEVEPSLIRIAALGANIRKLAENPIIEVALRRTQASMRSALPIAGSGWFPPMCATPFLLVTVKCGEGFCLFRRSKYASTVSRSRGVSS
jgi:hypothetical protein